GLEKDSKEPRAKLGGHPIFEGLGVADRKEPRLDVREHAQRGFRQAQFPQRFEGLQRVGIQLPPVIDARESRALDEVVPQYYTPKVHHLLVFGEEPVASDIEAKAVVDDRSRDSAHVFRIRFEHRRLPPRLAQAVSGGKAGRSRPDDYSLSHALRFNPPPVSRKSSARSSSPRAASRATPFASRSSRAPRPRPPAGLPQSRRNKRDTWRPPAEWSAAPRRNHPSESCHCAPRPGLATGREDCASGGPPARRSSPRLRSVRRCGSERNCPKYRHSARCRG